MTHQVPVPRLGAGTTPAEQSRKSSHQLPSTPGRGQDHWTRATGSTSIVLMRIMAWVVALFLGVFTSSGVWQAFPSSSIWLLPAFVLGSASGGIVVASVLLSAETLFPTLRRDGRREPA